MGIGHTNIFEKSHNAVITVFGGKERTYWGATVGVPRCGRGLGRFCICCSESWKGQEEGKGNGGVTPPAPRAPLHYAPRMLLFPQGEGQTLFQQNRHDGLHGGAAPTTAPVWLRSSSSIAF